MASEITKLARKLDELLLSHGVRGAETTQAEFARQMDVNPATLWRWREDGYGERKRRNYLAAFVRLGLSSQQALAVVDELAGDVQHEEDGDDEGPGNRPGGGTPANGIPILPARPIDAGKLRKVQGLLDQASELRVLDEQASWAIIERVRDVLRSIAPAWLSVSALFLAYYKVPSWLAYLLKQNEFRSKHGPVLVPT